VSFRFLAGAPPAFSKKSWGGQAERRRLLEGVGIILPEDLGEVSAVCADDILDAAVAAWTARRIAEGSSVSIPEDPIERDGTRDIVIRA
jgi:predicted RNase H-like nuclease